MNVYLCRFCIQMVKVMWSILNLETLENQDLTDTDSSHKFTCHTPHGQVSITHTVEVKSIDTTEMAFSLGDLEDFSPYLKDFLSSKFWLRDPELIP